MKSLNGYVRIELCALLAALSLLILPVSDGVTQPFVRELPREDGKPLVMSCGRWAKLYMAVVEIGAAKTILWLQMPQSGSRPGDVEYVREDILPTIESSGVKATFAGAWGICSGNQI